MPFANSAGTDIYYQVAGPAHAPETLLFAHGAGGNAGIWYQQTAHFQDNYRIITFDHRTFARSPCADVSTVTTQQFRDDALAILDALQVEHAHVIGQSMGGFTGLRLALDAPDRVASLTFSCTPGGLPNPQPTPAVRGLLSSSESGAGGVLATMAQASRSNVPMMRLYEELNSFNTQFSWANLGALGATETQVSFAQAGQVRCPVLFISGAEDPLFPPELLESYVPHFANARFVCIADAGHSPYFEQPQRFNQVLAEFLAA